MKQQYMISFSSFNLRHNLKDEEFAKLKKLVPEFLEYKTASDLSYLVDESTYEVCLDDLVSQLPDLEFKIKGRVYFSDNKLASEVHDDIQKMNNEIKGFRNTIEGFAQQRDMLNFNLGKNPVVINVQNDKLLAINELVEEKEADYDSVQSMLYAGWMIITTYVERTMGENGDAKPTYVLGRYNSELKGKEL